jgi:hypothetical protein
MKAFGDRKMRKWPRRAKRPAAIAAAVVCGALLAPAVAQSPSLAMLDGFSPGQWQLRYRDGSPPKKICIRSGRELIQLRHPRNDCSRYVVEDGASEVTVQYTCKGSNYGRTSIRRESGSLAQVESQGIAGGLPFQFTAEARRVGACN